VRACVSNRDTDPPIQKLLHAVDMLCIGYYEACQRKNRANSWNDCQYMERLSLAGRSVSTASAEKNLLGFRARASRIINLASGRGGPRYCGGQPSGLKTGCPRLITNKGRPPRAPVRRAARGGAAGGWRLAAGGRRCALLPPWCQLAASGRWGL
jgi:hypothetical protein